MTTVTELFEIRTGYTFRDSIPNIAPGAVAVVQAGDINAGRLAAVPRIQFVGDKHLLQAGDILLSARGSTIARTVTPDLVPAVAASSVMILRPKSDINSKFVTRFINSTTGQAALAKITSGSYIKTLRKSELGNLPIPTPPVTAQQTIVDLGEVIEHYKEVLKHKEQLITDIYNQAIKAEGASK